jgi:hypothetical protein
MFMILRFILINDELIIYDDNPQKFYDDVQETNNYINDTVNHIKTLSLKEFVNQYMYKTIRNLCNIGLLYAILTITIEIIFGIR